jgi:hypothetical protein
LIQERCRLPRERAIGYQSARNGVLEKTFSSLREKTPVEKDFPRSGVTPPPSLTQRGSQLEALGTRPHWLPPYGRFALRGCDPVSPLDPRITDPQAAHGLRRRALKSSRGGASWGPTSHGNPLFSHYSAPHALRKMFSLVLDPPVFDSGRCPFHFFDLEKKN